MKVTLLGCGGSGGVPLITGAWGACDPKNPKNRRTRSSLLVEMNDRVLLIDAGPDVRVQLLAAGVQRLDGVFITHVHADHIRGLDDLRPFALAQNSPLPIYGDKVSLRGLETGYNYAFHEKSPSYPPFLTGVPVEEGCTEIAGIPCVLFPQYHGSLHSWGLRFGDFAYSTDFHEIPEPSLACLGSLSCWVVECFRRDPHPSHSCLGYTLDLIDKVRPQQAILTHMSPDLDYAQLSDQLPNGVRPGHDGWVWYGY